MGGKKTHPGPQTKPLTEVDDEITIERTLAVEVLEVIDAETRTAEKTEAGTGTRIDVAAESLGEIGTSREMITENGRELR